MKNTTTRYAEIAQKLSADIATGTYKIGSNLPKEVELAEQLGVSRTTVRFALAELQKLGLISRKRNAGTRVEAMRPISDSADFFQQSLRSVEDLLQYSEKMSREVQEVASIVADDQLAEELRCRPGCRWLMVSALRRGLGAGSAAPTCWSDLYIDGMIADRVRQIVATDTRAMASIVEQQTGRPITEIEQCFQAVALSDRVAEALEAPGGSPALEIRRFYYDSSGNTPLVSHSIYPQGRFSYASRLRRNEAEIGATC
jgi:GntR family transcriptional regulator